MSRPSEEGVQVETGSDRCWVRAIWASRLLILTDPHRKYLPLRKWYTDDWCPPSAVVSCAEGQLLAWGAYMSRLSAAELLQMCLQICLPRSECEEHIYVAWFPRDEVLIFQNVRIQEDEQSK